MCLLLPLYVAMCIAPLVALTRCGTGGRGGAGGARVHNNADNKVAIAKAGGIAPLVALARDGMDGQKEMAARALGIISPTSPTARWRSRGRAASRRWWRWLEPRQAGPLSGHEQTNIHTERPTGHCDDTLPMEEW